MNVEEPSPPQPPGFLGRTRNKIKSLVNSNRTLIKFAIVGASGVVVNELVYYVLTRVFGVAAIPSQAIGVEIAIVNNFIWNDTMTFRNSRTSTSSRLRRFGKYNLLSLVTFGVNLIVFALLLSVHVFDIYASILAIVAAFGLNYFGSARWAFRVEQGHAHEQSSET